MKIGKYEIKMQRWPWQDGYNWGGTGCGSWAPLNSGGARFGGGWRWCLGISIGSRSIVIELLFGSIRINKHET